MNTEKEIDNALVKFIRLGLVHLIRKETNEHISTEGLNDTELETLLSLEGIGIVYPNFS